MISCGAANGTHRASSRWRSRAKTPRYFSSPRTRAAFRDRRDQPGEDPTTLLASTTLARARDGRRAAEASRSSSTSFNMRSTPIRATVRVSAGPPIASTTNPSWVNRDLKEGPASQRSRRLSPRVRLRIFHDFHRLANLHRRSSQWISQTVTASGCSVPYLVTADQFPNPNNLRIEGKR